MLSAIDMLVTAMYMLVSAIDMVSFSLFFTLLNTESIFCLILVDATKLFERKTEVLRSVHGCLNQIALDEGFLVIALTSTPPHTLAYIPSHTRIHIFIYTHTVD